MALEPLPPPELRGAEAMAVTALRRHIVSGGALPGARLTEQSLSDALRVSRATVRTALHQLTGEGLVKRIPYSGWEVMSLSAEDAWELFTLRASLEALATRLATETLTPAGRKAIQAAVERLVAACATGDYLAASDCDFGLHKAIVSLARHRRLSEQYQLVEQQIRLYIISSNALVQDMTDVVGQHTEMLAAIMQGDGRRAARLAEEHNEIQGGILVAHLRQLAVAVA
jgi:DNA-binding GntR family transcriptional regulator